MIDFSKILFLDIETVSQKKSYDQLSERMQKLWSHKAEQLNRDNTELTPADIYDRAGIYAEFGKIVCISVGFFNEQRFRLKSFYGHDEKALLNDFANMLNRYYSAPDAQLCAHNGKEFDFPYIARRMLVNGIQIPKILQVAGKKPWETNFIDTMELWKFGDYKTFTSLDLLCAILDIPTPKDDINGSEVGRVYWQENDIERIKTYCQKDVLAIAQLMRRYNYMSLIPEDCVDYTN
ncbi:MAG: 3'-5' exonuclease [Bacteroidales bacterium]|jgi:DNA polymerase elongation subunit (family B)|nr:3'-5' exonuclease [Bacteroidales bacterium]